MIGTRRIHLVLTGLVCVALVGFCFGPGALAASPEAEERPAEAGSVTVQVTPSSVPEGGGEVELFALVRDDRGRPLEKAKLNFLTQTGSLGSGGRLLTTGPDGGVTDRLMVTAAELAAVEENRFWLAAAVGSGGRQLVTEDVAVRIQRQPDAAFKYSPGGLLVAFRDVSAGQVTSRQWDFGDGTTSTRQSPAHTFAEPGHYAVTLRVGNSVGTDEVTRLVRVFGSQGAGE
jgi:hypothetical protein